MVTCIPMTEATYDELRNSYGGACLSCGELIHEGIEPDARNYTCPHCDCNQVFGVEELMVEEKIEFI